jgi:CubicO group peptidase (beta-lactamase class C family)
LIAVSRRTFLLNASALSLGASGCVSVPAPTQVKASVNAHAQLSETLAAIVFDSALPLASLSVAALKRGKLVYAHALGFQHAEKKLLATPDTLYRVASISKLVTTLGAMTLVDSGALDLDRDIGEYLGYPLRNPHFPSAPITARMLMCHTSSLRDEGGYFWEVPAKLRDALISGGALHGKGEMWAKNAPPGSFFEYANLPWGVLANVMERITNERFDRFMARVLFAPLAIEGGFHPFEFAPHVLARTATLYRKRTMQGDKELWSASGPWVPQVDDYSLMPPAPRAKSDYIIGSNGTAMSPQGGARLSVRGLATLMQLMMNGGEVNGVRVLSSRAVGEMMRTQWKHEVTKNNGTNAYGDAAQLFNAWGLGNQQFSDISGPNRGDRVVARGGFTGVGHLGDAYGLTSAFVFNPTSQDGLIFLSGGVGANPESQRGAYSAFYRYEERILTALHEGALR